MSEQTPRPDWMRPDFRYPEPSDAHKAAMADIRSRITFIDYTAQVRALQDLIASQADRIERLERALANVLPLLNDLDEYIKRPGHGEYGVECAVCMGEWFEPGDRDAINEATAALKGQEG